MAGIEAEFVEKPPKAFQCECPICLLVLREPYQATCCGKSFCKECIKQLKIRGNACPTCKTENFFSYPNKGLEQSLYDFKVYCSHKSKGCEWRGELRELDKHLNSEPPTDKSLEGCPFTVIECPLNLTGCEVKLPRKDIVIHVNHKLMSHVQTLMQNNDTLSAQLKTVSEHLQLVQEEKQHLEQRASTRIQEVEMENRRLLDRVARLERKVAEVTEHVDKIRVLEHMAGLGGKKLGTCQPVGPVEFTMTDFKHHKKDEWYSPPFYTHPHGYKMCLCVSPSGFGSGKGTHLGVTVNLMRGEFDDHLKWPFRGTITFLLLDQEGGRHRNDIVNTVSFDYTTPVDRCTRVVEEEVSAGWGYDRVLPLSDLKPKYLKNDCIKLHITKVGQTR